MNLTKSLEELENDKWSEPGFDSHLAKECHRLRLVPISQLSVENLRLLIGQKIGLKFLVPVALDILSVNPLVGGDKYQGDLLANVAAIPNSFWLQYPELNNQVVEIRADLEIIKGTITEELLPALCSRDYL